MLVDIVALFLGVSVLLYCLLGGADFGGGILEAFLGRHRRDEQKELISQAIGPVWEANHMWLVLAVVILFVGFPSAYSALSITFHIPLTLMLVGIILRGCAFAFRSYDAVRDGSQRYYAAVFVVASYLTPFMLGVVAGGLLLGRAAPPVEGFVKAFVEPWANLFSYSVGGFTCVLFAFLAAVYLIGETDDPELRRMFARRAVILNVLTVVGGILVFFAAQIDGLELAKLFISHPFSVASMVGATLLLAPLWFSVRRGAVQLARVFVAAQVGLVLLGWFFLQFPIILNSSGEPITIYSTAAPESTMRFLLYALVGGSALIFPALGFLMWIFKTTPSETRGAIH